MANSRKSKVGQGQRGRAEGDDRSREGGGGFNEPIR